MASKQRPILVIMAFSVNDARCSARLARPIRSLRPGSSSSIFSLPAICSGCPPSTRKPFSPSITDCPIAPRFVEMMGRPAASASTMTQGWPSGARGGKMKISARLSKYSLASSPAGGLNRTGSRYRDTMSKQRDFVSGSRQAPATSAVNSRSRISIRALMKSTMPLPGWRLPR